MNTRSMQAFASSRIKSETVYLDYPVFVDSLDGSAVVTATLTACKASVNDLNSNDIQRLEKAGIIIKQGVTIVIHSAPYEYEPEGITYSGKNYRPVNWAVTTENGNITVVTTCEEISIPAASI